MNTNLLKQFTAYLQRDIFVYSKRLMRYIFNYSMLYAIMYGVCFGYLLSRIGMRSNAQSSTVMFIGTILFALWSLSFTINADFLFDVDRDKFTEYQLTNVPYWLILLVKLVCGTGFLFVSILFFYPAVKLLFPTYFDISNISLVKTIIMLFMASLYTMCFQVLFASVIRDTTQTRNFYRRVNYPMIMLGGLLTPWKAMFLFSSVLGYAVLINPLIYVTEGLRNAILGSDNFISFWYCLPVLLFYSALMLLIATYFFKRKMDAV